MTFERLVLEAEREGVEVCEYPFDNTKLKGLYFDNIVTLNSIQTEAEKTCVLAEELGHYHTSYGNTLNQSTAENRKQERKARGWAYERLVSIASLISASKQGIRNRYELAKFLGVSERFVEEAIQYYKDKHGTYYEIDNYIVYFEPLGVLEKISEGG